MPLPYLKMRASRTHKSMIPPSFTRSSLTCWMKHACGSSRSYDWHGGAFELLRQRVDEVVALRRPFDAVGPVQAGVEPLRAVRGRHLFDQYEADFIVEGAGVGFRREVFAPSSPSTSSNPRGGGTPDVNQFRHRSVCPCPSGALLRHESKRECRRSTDMHKTRRRTGTAEVFLRENIDRDLRPLGRHHHVGHFENDRSVRITDGGTARGELKSTERILTFACKLAQDLHGRPTSNKPGPVAGPESLLFIHASHPQV